MVLFNADLDAGQPHFGRAGKVVAPGERRIVNAEARLREALLVARNRNWAEQIAAMLKSGKRPFVAVGAAHVAGIDGLPEMLASKGFTVKRVQ